MSHFSLLVIGDNVEERLSKYEEKTVPKYVKYTKEEIIQKWKKDIEKYKNSSYSLYIKDPISYSKTVNPNHLNYLKNEFPLKLKYTDEEIYLDILKGYAPDEIEENGGIYSIYNPYSKWDWYTIGGRFRDTFPIKKGASCIKNNELEKYIGSLYKTSEIGYADIALKKDIDWEKLHLNKENYNESILFWELKIENRIPKNKKEKNTLDNDWYKKEFYIERYKTKEIYAKCNSSFSTWAVVNNGEWFEKGKMGMFAMSDESDNEALDWELNFYNRFIGNLSKNTLLTIVDCHI